jgi:ATP-dependent DNA ligase
VVTLDGEAVVCGGDGIAVFEDLHRRGIVSEAMLYAFDLLEFGGEDLRPFPLFDRKRLLAKLVGRRSLGIVLSGIPTSIYSWRSVRCAWRASSPIGSPHHTGRDGQRIV